MSVVARLKQAAIRAVEQAGGKEGAAMTAERSPSTAANWRNRALPDLPPLDCAFRLDEAALIDGRAPQFLLALARELGFAAIRLPDADLSEDAAVIQLMRATAEFGEVAQALTEALADGVIDRAEQALITRRIDEAQEALTVLRALVLREDKAIAPLGG